MYLGVCIWAYGQNAINHLKSEVFLFPSPLPSLCTVFMWLVSVFPSCALLLGFVWTPRIISVFLSLLCTAFRWLVIQCRCVSFLCVGVGSFFVCVCVCLVLLVSGCVEVMCTQQYCIVSGPEHSSGPVWSPTQQVSQPWWGCGYWCCYPGKKPKNAEFDLGHYVFVYSTVFTMPLVDNLMFTSSVSFDW